MKHILILGAGLMQKPAIDSAHELGYNVTVFDGNADAHCKDLVERFEVLDLKYTDKLVEKALTIHEKEPFSAVFTAGTDFSFAVSSIASACKLPAHSKEAAFHASDKILMRSCFEEHSVPSPKFIEVTATSNNTELFDFIKTIEYPAVVKPCDNMGARGCRLARNEDELLSGIKDAISFSKTSRAIVEEYMEGPEFSIDALVCNNEVTITGFADRHIFYPPYFIEMGHSMPTSVSGEQHDNLVTTFVKGIRALGLTHGAAKADIKLTKNGAMVGEIAARLSGGYMSGWTFPYASGLNLTKQALLLALNNVPEDLRKGRKKLADDIAGFKVFDYPCSQHCIERAWISLPGLVENVSYGDSNNIKDVFPRIHEGEKAVFPVNNVEKAGNIIITADSREKAIQFSDCFMSNTIVHLQKNNGDTEEFLKQNLDTDFPPSAFQLPKEVYERIRGLETNEIIHPIQMPDFLNEYKGCKDWNGRTLLNTVLLVNEYIQKQGYSSMHGFNKSTVPNFWTCLIRGGIQGALFYLF